MEKNKRLVIIIGVVIVVILGISGMFIISGTSIFSQLKRQFSGPINYTIPGVPYIGAYNKKSPYDSLGMDANSAEASILEYWNPGKNNFADIGQSLEGTRDANSEKTFSSLDNYKKAFESYGYSVKTVNLQINELKKYINPETRTPLLFFMPLEENQPQEIIYQPTTILIGINESEKKLILHSFWFGNNYEISFDEFNSLWNAARPDQRNSYLVIQPNNYNEIISNVRNRKNDPYPARTSIMNNAQIMFKNYALSEGAIWSLHNDLAKGYQEKVKNDPNFQEYFPPFYKVRLYAEEATENLIDDKDYDAALKNINQAIALDYDLNKPFKDWPGVDFVGYNSEGVGSAVYRVLGDIYYTMGDFEKAKESYLKTLSINPQDTNAKRKLKLASLSIAGKKQ